MKVLVVGACGMLGHDLVPTLQGAGHVVVAADRIAAPGCISLDITDLAQVRHVLADVHPDAVVNSAAFTNVDAAEADPEAAYRVNALGSWNLALVCQARDIRLMYVSTDYVFDGTKGSAYDEYDPPNPQSVYGRSKRAGEIHVERLCRKYYIVRTAWLYGHGGPNFVETILKAGRERPELRVVNDQWGTPTPTVELSEVMCRLLESERYGTYHASGRGACTWYEFAAEILRQSGIETPVRPQTTAELARPAYRPPFSVLDHHALRMVGLDSLNDWQVALQRYLATRSTLVQS